jgi:tetratricopeptide (TPR) repeat protein
MSASWLRRALDLTEKVLARQPTSAEALALRGELRHRLVFLAYPAGPDSLLPLAKADLRDALDARPDMARAWNVLGQLFHAEGRFVEAVQAARNAFEADAYLDDVQSVLFDLFFGSLYLDRFDEARTWCRTGLERFPSNPNFAQCELTLLGWSAKGRRQADAAWRLLGDIERRDSAGVLSPMWGYRRMLVASVLARSGLADSARAVIERVRREAREHPGSSDVTDIEAYVRLQLGEREVAIKLLESYLEVIPSFRSNVARNPWYRDLHTDPRFRALVGLTG